MHKSFLKTIYLHVTVGGGEKGAINGGGGFCCRRRPYFFIRSDFCVLGIQEFCYDDSHGNRPNLFGHGMKGVIHSHLPAALCEQGGEMAVGNSRRR